MSGDEPLGRRKNLHRLHARAATTIVMPGARLRKAIKGTGLIYASRTGEPSPRPPTAMRRPSTPSWRGFLSVATEELFT